MLRRSALAALAMLLALMPTLARADGGGTEASIRWRTRWPHPPLWSTEMSNWRFIRPEATTNYVLNPSAEATGNYAALAGATVTRSTTYSKWGTRTFRVQTFADNDGVRLTLGTLANATHYVTVWVRDVFTLPSQWDWSLDDITYTSPVAILEIDDEWTIYGLSFPAAQANGSTNLYIRQNGGGIAGDFYLDGIQVEAKAGYWTTTCIGNLEGCEWNGAAHASTSSRSAQSRAGGRLIDFDTYHFDVGGMIGAGMAPQDVEVDLYALLPGGELNAVKETDRLLTLTGVIRGTTLETFHDYKRALVEELAIDRYPKDAYGYQPVRLWYLGAAEIKELKAFYVSGLEGAVNAEADPCNWEREAVRFIAPDPYWYEIGESSMLLDEEDSATFRIVARRDRDTGQWSDMGPPDPAGTYGVAEDIVEGQDGTIYIGGNFLNFDNLPNADHIVQYDPVTGTFSALNATPLSARVYALATGPDGTIYIGGDFQDAGGDVNADYFCQYNPNTSVFSSVNATPLNGSVYIITVGPDGTIYIGGTFTDAGGDNDADYVCQVDASTGAFSSLNATPLNNLVYALAVDVFNQVLYIGGGFTDAGGDNDADYLCQYDISAGGAFTSLCATPLSSFVYALAFSDDGLLYIGGAFVNAGGYDGGDRICKYNGLTFLPLGTGANQHVEAISIAPDNDVYIAGAFTEAGGVALADRMARWNGASWSHLDINLPGPATMDAIYVCNGDPVITQNYDIYVGTSITGSGDLAGDTTVNNPGTAHVWPTIEISASGTRTLRSVRNETTGKELLFDYTMLNGETLTIYLWPTRWRIISSFFGPRNDALLANSDATQFSLQPGDNIITCFVD